VYKIVAYACKIGEGYTTQHK